MKKIILAGMLLNVSIVLGQQFTLKSQIDLPDSIGRNEVSWVDLDNDGVLDILLSSRDRHGKQFFLTYKNDTTRGLLFKTAVRLNIVEPAFTLTDLDLDNDIDLVVSGSDEGRPTTSLLANDNDFSFTSHILLNRSGKKVLFGDLNSDGSLEMVLSGELDGIPFLDIYNKVAGSWKLVHDSLKIAATDLKIFDFDKDGDNDLAVSGNSAGTLPTTSIYYNDKNFVLREFPITPGIDGHLVVGDVNTDGYFDVIATGKNSAGADANVLLRNNGHTFHILKDTFRVLQNAKYLVADFNSNGRPDIHSFGNTTTGDTAHFILMDTRAVVPLNHRQIVSLDVGDYDHDGDLDLVEVHDSLGIQQVKILRNKVDINRGPGKPYNVISAQIFDRFFLYWERPSDDHTPSQVLTYDVTLHNAMNEVMVGEFDALNAKRLVTSFGNIGSRNYALLKTHATAYSFSIQSVDNSFHTGSGGICSGSVSCSGYEIVDIEACKDEVLTLYAPQALWFSFSLGLLSTAADSYVYYTHQPDTLFSVSPGVGGCPAIKLYNIVLKEKLVRQTLDTKYVCADQEVAFNVANGWKKVEWSSVRKGFISNANAITYKTLVNDTVKVKLSNGTGCMLQQNTAVQVSVPAIKLNGETFQILRGEKVQLVAEGGVTYSWSPAEGLNDPALPDPVASPLHTIQYTVVVTDSIGCHAQGNALVIVEGTAFIPNLFTPNDDGKNDDIRIYGLSAVRSFSFTIHNREGKIVFETHDANEATNTGWNGTAHGTRQPNGVYYWKVRGEQASGRPIQLNGKNSGSIVLIR